MKLEDFVEGQAYDYADIAASAGYSPAPGGNFIRGIVPAPKQRPKVITIKSNRSKGLYSDTYREGCKTFQYIGDGLPDRGHQKLLYGNRDMFHKRDLPVLFFLKKEDESKDDPWWFKGVWKTVSSEYVEDEEKRIPDGSLQKVFRFTLDWVASSLRRLPVTEQGVYLPSRPKIQLLNETDYLRATEETLQRILPLHKKLANTFWQWLMTRDFRVIALETDRIDVRFESDDCSYMAELKVVHETTPRMRIREALGQVFEYNYYRDSKPYDEWLIVLNKKPLLSDQLYVCRLNKELDLPLNMGWQARETFQFVRPL